MNDRGQAILVEATLACVGLLCLALVTSKTGEWLNQMFVAQSSSYQDGRKGGAANSSSYTPPGSTGMALNVVGAGGPDISIIPQSGPGSSMTPRPCSSANAMLAQAKSLRTFTAAAYSAIVPAAELVRQYWSDHTTSSHGACEVNCDPSNNPCCRPRDSRDDITGLVLEAHTLFHDGGCLNRVRKCDPLPDGTLDCYWDTTPTCQSMCNTAWCIIRTEIPAIKRDVVDPAANSVIEAVNLIPNGPTPPGTAGPVGAEQKEREAIVDCLSGTW